MNRLDGEILAKTAAWIARWKRPLLITHAKPDGDALGSLVAMRSMLRTLGADPMAMLLDPIPSRYALFQRHAPLPVWGTEIRDTDLTETDGVILLDTCAYKQLAPIADWLRATTLPRLAVDHHVTRDDLADRYLIDETAAANCLILYEWACATGWEMNDEALEALFIGIAMDTGWFRFDNTNARTLSAAGELVARGVSPHALFERLFQRETSGRIRLLGAALGSLGLLADGRLAVMALDKDDFIRSGAGPADTEDVVNEPMRIGSVIVSVLLVDQQDGVIRISLRSKPPTEPRASARANVRTPARGTPAPPPSEARAMNVDVAAIAQAFGGGGHTRAAGARIPGSLSDVRRTVVRHLEAALANPTDRKA